MSLEFFYDQKFNNPQEKVVGEAVASQLPGRWNGGAADAYRHILLAAELTRDYGVNTAFLVLTDHEAESGSGADNGLDMWNNAIGIKIGAYVRRQRGDWKDVVRLSRAVMALSFDGPGFEQVGTWKVRQADDGIRHAHRLYAELRGVQAQTFENFAENLKLNRNYAFRANDKAIVLEDGKLELFPAAMTSPSNWVNHPKVEIDGKEVELEVEASAFPTPEWFTGKGFIYEDNNKAPLLSFASNLFPGTVQGAISGSKSNRQISKSDTQAKDKVDAGNRDAAKHPQNIPRLTLNPTVHRLMSGDLSALDPKNGPFSPNLLRLLMGGKVPRVKGAARLEDIARPKTNRFDHEPVHPSPVDRFTRR